MKFVSPANQSQSDYSSSSLQSNVTTDPHHNVQPAGRLVFKHSFFPREQPEERRELTVVKAEVSSYDFLDQFKKRDSSSSRLSVPSMAENGSSPSSFPSECFVNPTVDSSIGQSVGMNMSSGNTIKVCPNVPNMKFPESARCYTGTIIGLLCSLNLNQAGSRICSLTDFFAVSADVDLLLCNQNPVLHL